jgi:hypothetical protein
VTISVNLEPHGQACRTQLNAHVGRHPGLKLAAGIKKEKKMKKMFSTMMEGFTKGMPEEDKKKMMEFVEKMAGMCSCVNWKDMSGDQRINLREEKKAMKEKMTSFCSGKMETMSSFFKKMGSQTEKTAKPENA